jgi:putative ABC transport system permease protein
VTRVLGLALKNPVKAGDYRSFQGSQVKFLPLAWAGLWRRPVRTGLTAVCILIAFVLLGLLEGVNAGFERTIANSHREFLVTNTRVRGGAHMPLAAMAQIKSLPGVEEVAPRTYFMGSSREVEFRNMIGALATYPEEYFRLRPNLSVSKADREALVATRMGMLATSALLELMHWKVGDTITLEAPTPKRDGSPDWPFKIVGKIETPLAPGPSYFGVINYDYFDEGRVENRGTAEVFYSKIADPTKAVAMAAAIDRIFANSPNETRTRSDQQRAELQAKQMGDVKFFTNAIMGAVLFTLAFLTGNTLRQALQERSRDFAVLKAMGYSSRGVLLLAYAEALLLYVPPAVIGLAIARLAAPLAREDIANIVVSPAVAVAGLVCAACLAFIGAALPALKLSRMPIATALGKR